MLLIALILICVSAVTDPGACCEEAEALRARVHELEQRLEKCESSRKASEFGTVTVERFFLQPNANMAVAVVSYTNDSSKTFESRVEIQCVGFDAAGAKFGANTRSFSARDRGPIRPGFEGTVEVPIWLNGANAKSARCKVSSAR